MAKNRDVTSFGSRLKDLREKEGLSVEDLAGQLGMKAAYLKSLEKDEVLPPVAEILTIARTLSVEPSAFMGGAPAKASPGKRRKAMSVRTSDYAYDNLTADDPEKHLMAFRVTIPPKSAHRKVGYSHEGEEFIYVLSGGLKITVGKKTRVMGQGENIHFDSGKKHMLSNPGAEPAVLLVVLYVQ